MKRFTILAEFNSSLFFQALIRRFSNAAADLERLEKTTAELQVIIIAGSLHFGIHLQLVYQTLCCPACDII